MDEGHSVTAGDEVQQRVGAAVPEAEGLSSSGRNVAVGDVDRGVNSHTVLATFPEGDAEGLGSANHIQVQLLDGQVIQITSASIVESEMQESSGVGSRGSGTLRNAISSPRAEGSSGAVTLLTADGKTYILPQPLSSEVETTGGYLITEEVLGTEGGRSSEILQHHPVLTIPSPLAPLPYPTPTGRHPDALAIAASEVFSENYSGLSLEAGNGYEESRAFQIHVKVPEQGFKEQNAEENSQAFSQQRLCTQKEVAEFSDCSIITIHAPNAEERAGEKTMKHYEEATPNDVHERASEQLACRETDHGSHTRKERLLRDIEDGIQQFDSSNYSALYSKLSSEQESRIHVTPIHARAVSRGKKVSCEKAVTEDDSDRKQDEESHEKILEDLQPLSTEVGQSCDSSVGLWATGRREEIPGDAIQADTSSREIWLKGNRDQDFANAMPNLVQVKSYADIDSSRGNRSFTDVLDTHAGRSEIDSHDPQIMNSGNTTDSVQNDINHVPDRAGSCTVANINPNASDDISKPCSAYGNGIHTDPVNPTSAMHSVCTSNEEETEKYSLAEGSFEEADDISSLSDIDTKVRRSARLRKIKEQKKRVPSEDPPQQHQLPEPDAKRSRPAGRSDQKTVFWECDKCDAMFRTKVSRDRHIQEDHVFTCYMCGWQGKNKTKYEVHISTVHCSQQARCLACRKDFQSYEAYKQHMKTAHSVNTDIDIKTEAEERPSGGEPDCSRVSQYEDGSDGKMSKLLSDDGRLEQSDASDSKITLNEDEAFTGYGEKRCPYCGKQFQRRSRLLRHINYHLDNRKFTCEYCTKAFVEKSGLDAHLLTHRPINKSCSECGKVFKTRRTMKRHLKTHQNVVHSCGVCGKQFRHEESLRIHKSVHKDGGSGNVCSLCKKDCKTPYYLQLHITTKHEAAKFTCLQCDRSFKWRQSYGKHMAIFHSNADMQYACPKCPKHFKTASELRLHQVAHSDEKKYVCDICGKVFKHEYTRDKHVKTVHQDKRDHMCPQCGSLFKAKAYLDQHLSQVHTTKERVKCLQCGHDFKTMSNLKSHIKSVHNSRNPKYTCETCNKTFMAPKDLARHTKVHTGVKDYVCPVCRRSFARKDNMVSHMRTHAKESALPPQEPHRDVAPTSIQPQDPSITHILGIPSAMAEARNTQTAVAVSSNSIVLSSIPVSSHNLTLSNIPVSSSIALSNPAVSASSISLPPESTTLSLSSVSSANVILSSVPSSSNSIILSRIPVSANNITQQSLPSSSNALEFSSSGSNNIVFSNTQLPVPSGSMDLTNTHSAPPGCLTLSTVACSEDNVISSETSAPASSLGFSGDTPSSSSSNGSHPVFGLQHHIMAPAQHEGAPMASMASLLPPCSAPGSSGTLSPHMAQQGNAAQMVWSRVGSEQVALAAGVLSLPSPAPPLSTENAQQYAQPGLYTIVGDSSKVTPLENFTLHSVEVAHPSPPAAPTSHQSSHSAAVSEQR
ncbi:uncharacterized protein [Penaeus vannamei]|uniref:uncharacterized protein n=1 Tax=Penaeus vannamei TaxID=6689 RepID=UPI000F65D61B|nr:uncharacterized protein LOC113815214 [Penaeus vannamei]